MNGVVNPTDFMGIEGEEEVELLSPIEDLYMCDVCYEGKKKGYFISNYVNDTDHGVSVCGDCAYRIFLSVRRKEVGK